MVQNLCLLAKWLVNVHISPANQRLAFWVWAGEGSKPTSHFHILPAFVWLMVSFIYLYLLAFLFKIVLCFNLKCYYSHCRNITVIRFGVVHSANWPLFWLLFSVSAGLTADRFLCHLLNNIQLSPILSIGLFGLSRFRFVLSCRAECCLMKVIITWRQALVLTWHAGPNVP